MVQRAVINRGLPALYVRSALDGFRQRRLFAEVETYCMFIGYPRSGHSLVGSLLDAHPEAVIAHELDALRYVRGGFRRSQIYALILRNDREFTERGRRAATGGYEYAVPNQHQGRFDRLRVIGDKRGGRSTVRLRDRPQLLERLQQQTGVPVRLVHVVRNPFDNISTIFRRRGKHASLPGAIDFYFSACEVNAGLRARLAPGQVLDLRHEDLIESPHRTIGSLVRFVGLDAGPGYLDDCASILFTSPRRTRHDAPWTPELRSDVERRIAAVDFLAGYSFDG
ncbi:MAG: hypothetical protein QOE35_1801 [Actinomycetota bacterium]